MAEMPESQSSACFLWPKGEPEHLRCIILSIMPSSDFNKSWYTIVCRYNQHCSRNTSLLNRSSNATTFFSGRLGTYFFWTGNVRLVAALALFLSLATLKQGEKEEHMCMEWSRSQKLFKHLQNRSWMTIHKRLDDENRVVILLIDD